MFYRLIGSGEGGDGGSGKGGGGRGKGGDSVYGVNYEIIISILVNERSVLVYKSHVYLIEHGKCI